jgi:hypothetical protein
MDEKTASYLVVGTEYGKVLVYDAQRPMLMREFQLDTAASAVSAFGIYDVQYHIVAASRDHTAHILSNDVCRMVLSEVTPIVGILAEEKQFHVALMGTHLATHNYTVSS